jgi:hypothetical protein
MVEAAATSHLCSPDTIDIGTECQTESPSVDWQSLYGLDEDQVLKCSCCIGTSVAELFGSFETSSDDDASAESNEEGPVTT